MQLMLSVLLSLCVVQAVLEVRVQAAAVAPRDCGETFQTQLQQLLTTKQSCDSAAFYDCCQVICTHRDYNTAGLICSWTYIVAMEMCFSSDVWQACAYVAVKSVILMLHATCDILQVKRLVPEAPTGEYTLRKLIGQPEEQFSSSVIYSTLTARCDMDTDGGGWMVIQRRLRLPGRNINFTRNWADYENGFGDLSGEFWYGLKNIHHLTTRDHVELRIDIVRESDGGTFSWTYQTFRVAGATDIYRLTIGEGQGTGGDAMAGHNGQQFTTYDNDNDNYSGGNCGYFSQGGWWYKSCYNANLNGPHETPSLPGVSQISAKIYWGATLSSVEMKTRVKECVPETC